MKTLTIRLPELLAADIERESCLRRVSKSDVVRERLRHGHLRLTFNLADELAKVLDLRAKYADVPMSLADACLVRMTETLPDPLLVTTDADFEIYRRHSRQIVPCLMP